MITQLIGHITDEDVDEVVRLILRQYRGFLHVTEDEEFKKLFSDDYSAHRKKHSLSWAVQSAFIKGDILSSGIKIELNKDKGNYRRPELTSSKISMFVLSDTTDFNAFYLREKYSMNADAFSRQQLFCYFLFTEKKERLFELSLCLPNEYGEVIAKETLLSSSQLIKIAA